MITSEFPAGKKGRLVLIFDRLLDIKSAKAVLNGKIQQKVILFSLTSDPDVIKGTKKILEDCNCSFDRSVNSAQAIEDQVKIVQSRICGWSARIGSTRVKNKSVRDWLLLPGYNLSAWWLGLLSEKNTLKTNAFFRFAQIRAIEAFLTGEKCDICLVLVSDRKLEQAIKIITDDLNIPAKVLSGTNRFFHVRIKSAIKAALNEWGLPGYFLQGLFTWFHFIVRGYKVRAKLSKQSRRMPVSESILFVSYFPAVDESAARKKIFKNKHVLALQEKLAEKHIPITWLLMPVPFDGYGFDDAVNLAHDFAEKGEKLFILEEFLSLGGAVKGLLLWFRQMWISRYLFGCLAGENLSDDLVGKACQPFVNHLWAQSFYGSIGIGGILYRVMYERVFQEINSIDKCIYFFEMHAWEKALNSAKNKINPRVTTIGFQHAAVSRNDLSYFYDKKDTVQSGKPSDLPLPDIVACNGAYLYELLSESGYPGLTQVESIRYLYMETILNSQPMSRQGSPVLLVAGAYDRNETRAMIALVYEAFPKPEKFDIWFKGHPSMPVEEIFKELSIDINDTGYTIIHGNISEYLGQAWAMLVSTSTVSVEALAFGCEVILPIFPDTMLINALADCHQFYHKVSTADDFIKTMDSITDGNLIRDVNEYRQFVSRYWNIDSTLPLWSKLLHF